MKRRTLYSLIVLSVFSVFFSDQVFAATWFVSTNGSDVADGTSWATARLTIQAAIDLAASNDTVIVSNGVYATGGAVVLGTLTNRIAITNAVRVISQNGPAVTTIAGAPDPAATNGDAAVRCAYVGTNAFLSGFTLTNGHTRKSGDLFKERSGGGVLCESSAVVSNCVLIGNNADFYGGGSCYGTLNNCTFSNNVANYEGGAAYNGTLNNCLLIRNQGVNGGGGAYNSTLTGCYLAGNSAPNGGGAYYGTLNRCILSSNSASSGGGMYLGTLNNCLLTSNSATYGGGAFAATLNNCTLVTNTGFFGGGAYISSMNNCIVYFNTAPFGNNSDSSSFNYSCTTPASGGTGNITNNPQFVNIAAGDFHFQVSSPCLDTGSNAYAPGGTDLDGNARISHVTVDMGAYEYQIASSTGGGYWAWAAAITNGLTNVNDNATGDGYPNLLKYATGSSAVMSDDVARVYEVLTNGQFAALFNRNTNAVDVTIYVEASYTNADGAAWNGIATNIVGLWGAATNVTETGITNPVAVTARDLAPIVTNRFFRLRVTLP